MNACRETADTTNDNELLLRIQVGDKYGFINEHGKIIIEPQFDNAGIFFSEGVCFARLGEKRGLIDGSGNFVVTLPDSIYYVNRFINGLAEAESYTSESGRNTYIITKSGDYFLPDEACLIGSTPNDSLYILSKNRIFNKNGRIIGGPYDDINYNHSDNKLFNDGLCAVKIGKKWGYIDREGKFIIDTIYYQADYFSNGLAPVVKSKEHDILSFITTNNKVAFSIDYKGQSHYSASDFKCNRILVDLDGKTNLFYKSGELIRCLERSYYDIEGFNCIDSLATIKKDGNTAKIDTMGNIVLNTNYDDVGPFLNSIALVCKGNNYGYIDRNGKEIINTHNHFYEHYRVEREDIESLNNSNSHIRAIWTKTNGISCMEYYDIKGNIIWSDMPFIKNE